jgi:hypothetical protein
MPDVPPKAALGARRPFCDKRRSNSSSRVNMEVPAVKTWLALLSLFVVAALPLPGLAEEEGFGLPNLNPFAEKSGPPVSSSVSDAPTSGWKMPKLPNPFAGLATKSSRSKPAGPSGWQKMTTSTKTFFSKTADVLNPFDDANDKQQEIAPSGSKSIFSRTSAKKEESKGFFSLPSWSWGGEEEPKKPKTVQDFLAQPRPDF